MNTYTYTYTHTCMYTCYENPEPPSNLSLEQTGTSVLSPRGDRGSTNGKIQRGATMVSPVMFATAFKVTISSIVFREISWAPPI